MVGINLKCGDLVNPIKILLGVILNITFVYQFKHVEIVEDDELAEDTSHEYWARGRNGQGQNMLGKLLMVIREGIEHQHSMKPRQVDYHPTANGSTTPCYKCGEGNHTESTLSPPGIKTTVP